MTALLHFFRNVQCGKLYCSGDGITPDNRGFGFSSSTLTINQFDGSTVCRYVQIFLNNYVFSHVDLSFL